jgi:CPA2 family monovalent cation:H+ antiporter-2
LDVTVDEITPMENSVYLRDLVIILAVAVGVVAVLHRFKIPSIAGFILAGVIVGPQALGIISDVHEVEVLAEVGVALLLFGIGLEMSLERLRRLWWPILVGGFLQVGLTVILAFFIAQALGLVWRTSLFIGFLFAVSSTAIVLRGLQMRGEVDAPHGRLTLGILVFQDLCVIPMMLAIPLLGGSNGSTTHLLLALIRAVAIIAGVLVAARFVLPRILAFIARTRQRHLFVTTVLLICVGTAWIISSAGISLALGAFLAGLVVAGSEFRHQAMADVIPFKDVFTGIFFVSVGMLLAPASVTANIFPVTMLFVAILVGKAFIVFCVGTIMRLPLRVSVLAAVALAQMGEFSFILIRAAGGTGLLDPGFENTIMAAAILSMFVTPIALSVGPQLAAGIGRVRVFNRLQGITSAQEASTKQENLIDHVIIGGYGFAGRQLADALRHCGIAYVIADMNSETVRSASARGERIYYGDITSADVLEYLGIHQARGLTLVINDPGATEQAVRVAREVAPDVRIMVRTNYLLDIEPLLAVGADEVVSAEVESAGAIVSKILQQCRIEKDQIDGRLEEIRRNQDENSA